MGEIRMLDQTRIKYTSDHLGHLRCILRINPEAVTQGRVFHTFPSNILQGRMLVTGPDTLLRGHFGKAAERKVQFVGAALSARQPVAGKVAFQLLDAVRRMLTALMVPMNHLAVAQGIPLGGDRPAHIPPARLYPCRQPRPPQDSAGPTSAYAVAPA